MKITCPRCKRRIKIRRGEQRNCACGKYLDYRTFFKKRIPYDVFLLDANVFIYAFENDNLKAQACKKIIYSNSESIKIGTTNDVLNEIGEEIQSQLPNGLIRYSTGKIEDELLHTRASCLKQPSEADMSLLKASIEHPEIHGLITYDYDFQNIATAGIVSRRSSRKFWLGDAEKFVLKKLRYNN